MPRPFRHSHLRAGFTLLELTIVLTIIGLIVGGIFIARDMIRSAEVQSVVSDEDDLKKAIELFKEKYNYLPGDMPMAESFWGSDTTGGGCSTQNYSAAGAVPKTATCNGDGDGRIDTFAEAMRAWQQLADAGFIQGGYSGIQGNANANSLAIGTDVPASRVPGCGWMMGYIPATAFGESGYNVSFQQGTRIALVAAGADLGYPPCLTPAETYGIDTKIDDGLAYSGNVIDGIWAFELLYTTSSSGGGTWAGSAALVNLHTLEWHCATASSTWTQYNTSSSDIYCDPFFNTGL